jgi:hypothetical protein
MEQHMEYQDACGTAARAAEFTDFPGKRSLFAAATARFLMRGTGRSTAVYTFRPGGELRLSFNSKNPLQIESPQIFNLN